MGYQEDIKINIPRICMFMFIPQEEVRFTFNIANNEKRKILSREALVTLDLQVTMYGDISKIQDARKLTEDWYLVFIVTTTCINKIFILIGFHLIFPPNLSTHAHTTTWKKHLIWFGVKKVNF
ncbi:hypothetical protein ACJX0J_040327, partial [Zea mays]